MTLPVRPPVAPMLAKLARELPRGPGLFYEPKWDGFRCIVFRDGDDVELGSRNEKPLTRYFPELVEALRRELPERCVLDGEIVIAGPHGLEFDALSQRIHPAVKRIRLLAESTPASFVAFDLLAEGDRSLLGAPYVNGAPCWSPRSRWPARRSTSRRSPTTPTWRGTGSPASKARGLTVSWSRTGHSPISPTSGRWSRSSTSARLTAWSRASARTRTGPEWAHCSWGCSTAPGRCTTSAWRRVSAWRVGASWSANSGPTGPTRCRTIPGRAGPRPRRRGGRPEAGTAGTPGRT